MLAPLQHHYCFQHGFSSIRSLRPHRLDYLYWLGVGRSLGILEEGFGTWEECAVRPTEKGRWPNCESPHGKKLELAFDIRATPIHRFHSQQSRCFWYRLNPQHLYFFIVSVMVTTLKDPDDFIGK
jgi:hypothetical protein